MTEILHHLYLNWQMGIRVRDLGVTLFCSLPCSSGEAGIGEKCQVGGDCGGGSKWFALVAVKGSTLAAVCCGSWEGGDGG